MASATSQRFLRGGPDVVAYGPDAIRQLAGIADDLGVHRLLAVTGRSLALEGSLVAHAREILGTRIVGVFSGARAHTPDVTVYEGRAAYDEAGADGILSLGGSSVVDTAKAIALVAVAGNDMTPYQARFDSVDGVPVMRRGIHHDELHGRRGAGSRGRASLPPVIAVPTTLSGAEFTDHSGVTFVADGVKRQVYHPDMVPAAVVLDPGATATTPLELWLSTGIKVLDHAVEILLSPRSSPVAQATCLSAFDRVFTSLAASADPADLGARHEMLVAAWLALAAYPNQMAGLDHAIGHQLGGLCDVPHGIAPCCTLPHSLRFNQRTAPAAFAAMARRLPAEARTVGESEPAQVIAAVERLIYALGLPSRLRDVGVERSMLPRVADLVVAVEAGLLGNPRPVSSAKEVLVEVLEPAW